MQVSRPGLDVQPGSGPASHSVSNRPPRGSRSGGVHPGRFRETVRLARRAHDDVAASTTTVSSPIWNVACPDSTTKPRRTDADAASGRRRAGSARGSSRTAPRHARRRRTRGRARCGSRSSSATIEPWQARPQGPPSFNAHGCGQPTRHLVARAATPSVFRSPGRPCGADCRHDPLTWGTRAP